MADMKVEGFQELLDEVARLGKEGAKIENKALKEAGEIVKESIQSVTPMRTGKLKESIMVSGVKTKDGIKCVEIGPDKDAYYSRFVEFGTVKMKAKPYMAPGYESSRDAAEAAIIAELRRGLGL